MTESPPHHPLTIIGGGIGGLVLALSLDQAYNRRSDSSSSSSHLEIHVYESTAAYTAEAGGAIGLYPNGLRVIQNLSRGFVLHNSAAAANITNTTSGDDDDNGNNETSNNNDSGVTKFEPSCPDLLTSVRTAGCPYIYRRWMRHDGVEVAVAREDELLPQESREGGDNTTSVNEGDAIDDTANNSSCSTTKEVKVIDRRRNSLAGKNADVRPRGGSFRNLSEAMGGSSNDSHEYPWYLRMVPPPPLPAVARLPQHEAVTLVEWILNY